MNEPIDILAVAARRAHEARQAFLASRYMQSSPAASMSCERAIADCMLANADMEAAHQLCLALADAESSP